jgi:Lysozyme inhibitor LprI
MVHSQPIAARPGRARSSSDKAALEECLKYVDDFAGNVPGIDANPSPADHLGNEIKLAGHQPASCIDYVTELCSFESEDGRSELGMTACADREVLVWEDRLNATYKALLAKVRPELRNGYRKMQRAPADTGRMGSIRWRPADPPPAAYRSGRRSRSKRAEKPGNHH